MSYCPKIRSRFSVVIKQLMSYIPLNVIQCLVLLASTSHLQCFHLQIVNPTYFVHKWMRLKSVRFTTLGKSEKKGHSDQVADWMTGDKGYCSDQVADWMTEDKGYCRDWVADWMTGDKGHCSDQVADWMAGDKGHCSDQAADWMTGDKSYCSDQVADWMTGDNGYCSDQVADWMTGNKIPVVTRLPSKLPQNRTLIPVGSRDFFLYHCMETVLGATQAAVQREGGGVTKGSFAWWQSNRTTSLNTRIHLVHK